MGRGRRWKLKESRAENTASLGQVSIPQSRPADRSRASNTDLPPLTPPASQASQSASPHQASPAGADGGPPFCELRNGPRSNARDKFTGRRAGERSRLKIQPPSERSEKGIGGMCIRGGLSSPSRCIHIIRACV